MTLSIIFKNSHFAVIDKPPGTLSVPSRFGKADDRPVVGLVLQEQLGIRIFPVHRLDEEVSGVLMFALTAEAHKAANHWFELHEVVKTYEARSIAPANQAPVMADQVMVWESKLMRGKKRAYEATFGKDALTKAKLMTVIDSKSIWHLQPLTGRSHQLRYEMAKHGFPIEGDHLYGSTNSGPDSGGIALRAVKLDFVGANGYRSFDLPDSISLDSKVPITPM